ncbi:hypothetical protein AOLI_G00251020 [Acnodon oligacanthus]
MVNLRVGILLIIFLLVFKSHAFTAIDAVVDDPVTLPCEIVCLGDGKWTIFIPTEADVAHCLKGICTVENRFQERFAFQGNASKGNFSLQIRSVVYNDKGSYRCSCDGKVAEVKLKVFVPTVVMALVLENVTLPCYGDTRRDAKDVQWKKDGQKILLYNHWKQTMATGEGFEDRFALSKEAFLDGKLSLHITSVRLSDAGLYLCSIHEEFREGEPRAVLLKVKESSHCWCLEMVIVLAIGLVLVIFLTIYLCLKTRNSSAPDGTAVTNPVQPVQEQSELINTAYDSCQAMDPKNSSTRPF